MKTEIPNEPSKTAGHYSGCLSQYGGECKCNALDRRDYERMNHCVFSDAEWDRILSEQPVNGIPIAARNGFELALYQMPKGSKFVTLRDGSDATWEAYCALLAKGEEHKWVKGEI